MAASGWGNSQSQTVEGMQGFLPWLFFFFPPNAARKLNLRVSLHSSPLNWSTARTRVFQGDILDGSLGSFPHPHASDFISFLRCKCSWGQKSPRTRSTKCTLMFHVSNMQMHKAGGRVATPTPNFLPFWIVSDDVGGLHRDREDLPLPSALEKSLLRAALQFPWKNCALVYF